MNTGDQSVKLHRGCKLPALILVLAVILWGMMACSNKKDAELTVTRPDQAAGTTAEQRESVSAGTAVSATESVKMTVKVTEKATEAKATEPPDERKRSGLTGLLGDRDLTEQPIVAVMLDNSPDARPQAALAKADVVFEERVEGSMTRYMAIFQSYQPELIGPIRSGRQNFIDRMLEFDAVYARYGGSYEADDFVAANLGWVKDVNGMIVGSQTIWRYFDTGKVAPHNAYASYDSIVQYANDAGYDLAHKLPGWQFYPEFSVPDQTLGGQPVAQAVLEYGYNQTLYIYRDDLHRWERRKDGVQDLDENDQAAVLPANVIIQFAASEVYDAGGHQRVYQFGEGTGYLLTAGQQIPIVWEKDERGSPTRFLYAANGQPIQLNPGQTWIQVIEEGGGRYSAE